MTAADQLQRIAVMAPRVVSALPVSCHLHEPEVLIVRHDGRDVAEKRKLEKSVPPPHEVVGRRGEKPAAFDCFLPMRATDLAEGFLVRQVPKSQAEHRRAR